MKTKNQKLKLIFWKDGTVSVFSTAKLSDFAIDRISEAYEVSEGTTVSEISEYLGFKKVPKSWAVFITDYGVSESIK